MPFLAALVYWWRVSRRDIHPSLKRRYAGGAVVWTFSAVLVELWVKHRPQGVPVARFGSEVVAVMSVWLMSCSLVLATRSRRLEPWFGGLDRMYIWHRRTATVGALLIPLHLALLAVRPGRSQAGGAPPTSALGNALGALALLGLLVLAYAPRLRTLARVLAYQRWFVAHRFIGIFVLAATVHGLLVDPILRDNGGLMALYVTVGALGTVAYLQRELIAPWRRTDSPYLVAGVDRLGDSTLDVRLTPVGEPLSFRAGQFVFISFGGVGGWQSHPFTVASAPSDPILRLSIRTLGDHTAELHRDLSPGTPARLSGPHGMFDHELGGPKQIWIAAGIGITPFLRAGELVRPRQQGRPDQSPARRLPGPPAAPAHPLAGRLHHAHP